MQINHCWNPSDIKKPAHTVKVSTDVDDKLTIILTQPKCIKFFTFFVYDRLNILNLIHFSGTDFTLDLWYRLLLESWLVLVQTVNTDTSHKQATDSLYGSGGIRWLCFWTVSWYNSTSCSYSTTIYSSKETHSKHKGRSCPACQCRLVDLSVLLETCMPPIVRITMTTCPMQHMSVFLCMEGILLLPYLLKCS